MLTRRTLATPGRLTGQPAWGEIGIVGARIHALTAGIATVTLGGVNVGVEKSGGMLVGAWRARARAPSRNGTRRRDVHTDRPGRGERRSAGACEQLRTRSRREPCCR